MKAHILFSLFIVLLALSCAKDKLEDQSQFDLQVLSLNTFLLDTPDIVGGPVCESDCAQRAQQICDVLSDSLDNSPQLLLFQEVFELDACEVLVDCLSRQGYNYNTPCLETDPDWVNNCFLQSSKSSGLMLFSKQQISEYSFHSFDDCNGCINAGSDCQSNKGFQYGNINLGENNTLHIINTHLDAGDNQDDLLVRIAQLDQIAQYINQIGLQAEDKLIIGGDFNTLRFDELTGFNATLNLITANEIIPTGKDGYVLDHILFSNTSSVSLKDIILTGECNVECSNWFTSDHLGLIGKFEIDCL